MSLHKILLMAAIAAPVAMGTAAQAFESTYEPVFLIDDHDDDDKKKKKMKKRKYKMSEEMKAKKAKCEAMEGEDKAACMKKLKESYMKMKKEHHKDGEYDKKKMKKKMKKEKKMDDSDS